MIDIEMGWSLDQLPKLEAADKHDDYKNEGRAIYVISHESAILQMTS